MSDPTRRPSFRLSTNRDWRVGRCRGLRKRLTRPNPILLRVGGTGDDQVYGTTSRSSTHTTTDEANYQPFPPLVQGRKTADSRARLLRVTVGDEYTVGVNRIRPRLPSCPLFWTSVRRTPTPRDLSDPWVLSGPTPVSIVNLPRHSHLFLFPSIVDKGTRTKLSFTRSNLSFGVLVFKSK